MEVADRNRLEQELQRRIQESVQAEERNCLHAGGSVIKPRVLCVDDEISILALLQAQLAANFEVVPAPSGEQGLAAIEQRGPFAVIIADMHMPGMSGAEFLARTRVVTPDSVRVLLTGNADIESAIAAVNEGDIFRFLTKPCPLDILLQALQAASEQHRLITSEKELLEKTLRGSIKVLIDLLALINPLAFGRASRIQRLVKRLATALGVKNTWDLEVAALLSEIGYVTMPETLLAKINAGEVLSPKEREMHQAQSRIAQELLAPIPRLDAVVESIACREHRFDGQGLPNGSKKGLDLPLGARLLKIALDLDGLEGRETSRLKAIQRLKERAGWYDPAILAILDTLPDNEARFPTRSVRLEEMRPYMILGEDVRTTAGLILVRKGQEISSALLQRLLNFSVSAGIQEPILVLVPTC
jgi:response regulator RpfG family c-di-GMP phosphodiesterase